VADIYKVAGIVLEDKKMLVVHKKTLGMYISLGGKKDTSESELECLARENLEEVGCFTRNARHYRTFNGKTHDGQSAITISCYFCDLEGEITLNPEDNIDGYAWIGRDYKEQGIRVAPMLEEQIIPALISERYL